MLFISHHLPNSQKANDNDLNKWIKEMTEANVLIGDFNFLDVN